MERIDDLSWRWAIVREQLNTLWAFNRQSTGANEFQTFLTDGFSTGRFTLTMFNHICFFLLGYLNREERDKLIKWPIVNIQGQAKFRKGVSTIVKDLILKYPYFNLIRLPESYLIDPNHNQNKILEFILKLSNLAIYIAINDPSTLLMNTRNDLNESEIEAAINMAKQAKVHEENIIRENEFPVLKFEGLRVGMADKCVALKKENQQLSMQLNKTKKQLIEKGILKKDSGDEKECLEQMYNEKLTELREINKELQIYSELGKNVSNQINALEEPVSLTADDFGLNSETQNLVDATSQAYNNLYNIFNYLKSRDIEITEKEDYHKKLVDIKTAMLKEQDILKTFISKATKCLNKFNQ